MATAVSAETFTNTVFIENSDIDVNDGTLSDWPEDSQVVDESTINDVAANTWCWDGDSGTWDSSINSQEDCLNSYFYNGDSSMDILTGYFGVNDQNFLMGLETGFPLMSIYDTTNNEYVEFFELVTPGNTYGLTTLPEAYDHSMVFAFGPESEETFSYYIVADLNFPQLLADVSEDFSDVSLTIYKESGDTVGWQGDEDQEIGDLDPDAGETTGDGEDSSMSTIFEVKQNIGDFFDLTGFTYESYGFRFETHSTATDTSDRVLVDFGVAGAPGTLTKSQMSVKKRKKRQVKLKWEEATYAETYTVQLRKCKNEVKKKCSKKKHFQKKKKYRKFKALTGTTKTVKKLKKGTYYQWRIKGVNSVGSGDYSKWKRFKTKG